MQISNQIEQLIYKLNELKPTLSSDSGLNQSRFNNILKNSLEKFPTQESENSTVASLNGAVTGDNIPHWVNPDYGYDPENPRKPNMREMMEAISGKSVEQLYSEEKGAWQKISTRASEMLFGVIGSEMDTRDWAKIMTAQDIIKEARKETGKMHTPKVDIKSELDDNDNIVRQYAVLKNTDGNHLRSLIGNPSQIIETMHNFGVTESSIPTNLETKISDINFDSEILEAIKNYTPNSLLFNINEEFEANFLKTSTHALNKRIVTTIPEEEFDKL